MITEYDKNMAAYLICCAEDTVDIPHGALLTSKRDERHAIGRQIVMNKLRDLGYSLTDIAQLMKRNHATVINAINSLRVHRDVYAKVRELYNKFEQLTEDNMNKYRNKRFTNEYGTWDSNLEYYRFLVLLQAQKQNKIEQLERQKVFELIPAQKVIETVTHKTAKGVKTRECVRAVEKACSYIADFCYMKRTADGQLQEVIEDTKGYRTKDYIIKRKLMRFQGHPIREIKQASESV